MNWRRRRTRPNAVSDPGSLLIYGRAVLRAVGTAPFCLGKRREVPVSKMPKEKA
jgi:hypothetical protein